MRNLRHTFGSQSKAFFPPEPFALRTLRPRTCYYVNTCENNNLEVFDIYEDKCTGKSDSRPAFDELMQDMRDKRFNTIIVYKLKRIGR